MIAKQDIETIDKILRDNCLYEPIDAGVINKAVWNLQKALPGWIAAYKPYFGENDEDPSGMENNAVDFLLIHTGEVYLFHIGPAGVDLRGMLATPEEYDKFHEEQCILCKEQKHDGEMKKTYNLSLIEWYQDDIGQYQDKLPRSIERFQMKWGKFATEDEEGGAILDELERIYKVKPVLISWDIPEADEA